VQAGVDTKRSATERGRKAALDASASLDGVFAPRGMVADDAKVLIHPVDFVVFDGMGRNQDGSEISRVVILDERRDDDIQRSIEAAVRDGSYDFNEVRISVEGEFTVT